MGGLAAFAAALDRAAAVIEDRAAIEACTECANQFLAHLKDNTPVETGALRDSERVDDISGGGAHATATISTHLPLYASFRETGGTITVKHARVLTDGASFFGKSVTQGGSHYMARTVAWAEGALPGICDKVITDLLHEAGL